MRISEFIASLQNLQAEYGDLPVQKFGYDGERIVARHPEIAHALILEGRERKERFWQPMHNETRKGEKVVRI